VVVRADCLSLRPGPAGLVSGRLAVGHEDVAADRRFRR
jgi:hypothetical protein